jgi:U3 small nucleolar RNA-associated protein 12
VCSSSSNSVYDGRLAFVSALEDVLVWDVKKGQMVGIDSLSYRSTLKFGKLAMWHETGHREEVTCILRSPQKDHFAVGYADGSIRLWSASAGSVLTTFNGHKKAITALAFDARGTRLASGSQDTDLIVWDVVGEAGLFRCVSSASSFSGCMAHRTDSSASGAIATRSPPFDFFLRHQNLRLRKTHHNPFCSQRQRTLS